MLTSTGYGAISPIGPAKVYRAKAGRNDRAQVIPGGSSYDSVTLSVSSQDSRFLDMVSQLSREVRTATTTGDIAALRQQVASNQYVPDPMAIAGRILFLGEG